MKYFWELADDRKSFGHKKQESDNTMIACKPIKRNVQKTDILRTVCRKNLIQPHIRSYKMRIQHWTEGT